MNVRSCYKLLLSVVLAACAALCALAQVLVCPKCGHENLPGSLACEHCKAEMPVATKPSAGSGTGNVDNVFLPTGKLQFLGSSVVDDEILRATDCIKTGDLYLARCFLRNAAGLETLTDPAVKNDRAKRILDLMRTADPGRGQGSSTCPVCGGSGKAAMKVVDLKGDSAMQEVAGKGCPRCGGTGMSVTAPSETLTPVPASATCMMWRANAHAGCSGLWCSAVTLQKAV